MALDGARRDSRRGAHPQNRLTAAMVKKAKPGRHADGNCLHLVVDPSGARRWVLRVVVFGKRRDIGLGSAALVSLAEAREEAARLRKIARQGGDPIAERDREKLEAMTFEEAARTVHRTHVLGVNRNAKANAQWISSLESYAFPAIGKRPAALLDQADVLKVLMPIWTAKPETAKRVKQRIKTVIDWARAHGMGRGAHPVEGIEKALPRSAKRQNHHAALPYRDLPALWRRLEAVEGMGALALKFAILTGARSGEVRGARWSEIDLSERVWTVAAERMKNGLEHRVPLSDPAIDILRHVADLRTAGDALVFPGQRGKALSDMTLAAVLKRLKVGNDVATVHGFRSTFRDWAEETTVYPHEVKEAALAHATGSETERAYRRTDHFQKRRALMTEWAAFVVGAV